MIIGIGIVSGTIITGFKVLFSQMEKQKELVILYLLLGVITGITGAVMTTHILYTGPIIFGIHILPALVGGMILPYKMFWLIKKMTGK